jgi:hypothetical protein
VQEECDEEPGPVLAADAVNDDAALGGARDGSHGGGHVRPKVLEEDQVDVASPGRGVGGGGARVVELLRDLVLLALAALHEGHVHDAHGQLAGRVVRALVVAAEIDHRADAVIDERPPASLAQLPDAVRPHDGAGPRLAAVARRQPAEVPDVEAAVPDEVSRPRPLQAGYR